VQGGLFPQEQPAGVDQQAAGVDQQVDGAGLLHRPAPQDAGLHTPDLLVYSIDDCSSKPGSIPSPTSSYTDVSQTGGGSGACDDGDGGGDLQADQNGRDDAVLAMRRAANLWVGRRVPPKGDPARGAEIERWRGELEPLIYEWDNPAWIHPKTRRPISWPDRPVLFARALSARAAKKRQWTDAALILVVQQAADPKHLPPAEPGTEHATVLESSTLRSGKGEARALQEGGHHAQPAPVGDVIAGVLSLGLAATSSSPATAAPADLLRERRGVSAADVAGWKTDPANRAELRGLIKKARRECRDPARSKASRPVRRRLLLAVLDRLVAEQLARSPPARAGP